MTRSNPACSNIEVVAPTPGRLLPRRAAREVSDLPSRRQLLKCPPVTVRVTEGDERSPRLNVYLADRYALTGELLSRSGDVLHDYLEPALRAWWHLRDAGAHSDRARRSGRGELHEAQGVRDLMVDIGVETDLLDVERLGSVDISHGNEHQFEFPIHDRNVSMESDNVSCQPMRAG